jgi:hypothetical protein
MTCLFASVLFLNWWLEQTPLFLAVCLAGFLVCQFLRDRTTRADPPPQGRKSDPLIPRLEDVPGRKTTFPRRGPENPVPQILNRHVPAPDPKEKRKHLRREGPPVEVLISDAQARAEPRQGWVKDRSRGGLCLQVSEPAPVGTALSVRATHAPDSSSWVRLRVRGCRQQGDQWELRGEFEEELPWGVLLLFG